MKQRNEQDHQRQQRGESEDRSMDERRSDQGEATHGSNMEADTSMDEDMPM